MNQTPKQIINDTTNWLIEKNIELIANVNLENYEKASKIKKEINLFLFTTAVILNELDPTIGIETLVDRWTEMNDHIFVKLTNELKNEK